MGLCFVLVGILSLLLNIFFKKFSLPYFFLFDLTPNLIGLVFFSVFWIKSLYPIIFVSSFWILSNMHYILWIVAIKNLCELEEYFYSVILFNYSIFLSIIKYLLLLGEYFYENVLDNIRNNEKYIYIKIVLILLYHYAIIIIFVGVGFYLEWNNPFKESSTLSNWLIIPLTIINVIIAFILIFFIKYGAEDVKEVFIINHFFYIPNMIIYAYVLSSIIEENHILIFLLNIIIDFISIIISKLIFKTCFFSSIGFSCYSSSVLLLIFIGLSWSFDSSEYMTLLLFTFLFDSYLWYLLLFVKNKYRDSTMFSTIVFEYGFSSLVLYFLGIILLYVLYIISCFGCQKDCDDDCKSRVCKNDELCELFSFCSRYNCDCD